MLPGTESKMRFRPNLKKISQCFQNIYLEILKHREICLRYQHNRIFNLCRQHDFFLYEAFQMETVIPHNKSRTHLVLTYPIVAHAPFPMALRSPHVVLLINVRDACWTLPQQRQANQLLHQWEPFMVSPHPVRGSSPSKLSKMILNAGGSPPPREPVRVDASMWEHVYQSRTPTKEPHHIPTAAPSMYRSPNSKQHTPIRSPGSREKLREREKVR